MPPKAPLKKYIFILSLLLFLLSLTQKCYCTTSSCADSILVLMLGWAAAFSSAAGIAWFANPLLLAAWITLRKNIKASMLLSAFATLLSLSFMLFGEIIDNEAGHQHQITGYQPGYWLWLGSSVVMFVGSSVLQYRANVNALKAR